MLCCGRIHQPLRAVEVRERLCRGLGIYPSYVGYAITLTDGYAYRLIVLCWCFVFIIYLFIELFIFVVVGFWGWVGVVIWDG